MVISIIFPACSIFAQSLNGTDLNCGMNSGLSNMNTTPFDMNQTSDTATGCIYGFVTDLITGKPVEGSKVTASTDFQPKLKSKGQTFMKKKYSSFTDEDGFYVLENLPEGMHEVMVKAENYYQNSKQVEFIFGKEIQVDFELNPCVNGATGELNGYIHDAITGEPITGAKVTLKIPFKCTSEEDFDGDGNYQTKTGDEGEYIISEIPVGEFVVSASAKGYETESESAIIEFGDITTLDFELIPCDYENSGSVNGIVRDKYSQAPIADARIFVRVIDFTPGCGSPMHKVISDEDGFFSFEKLPSGTHSIAAWAKGYIKYSGEVTLETGESTEYDIELDSLWVGPTGILEGYVIDSKGDPVEGAAVKLIFKKVMGTKAFQRLSPKTDADGFFMIDKVPVGELKITARKKKLGKGDTTTEIFEDEVTEVEIVIAKGKSDK